MAWNEDVETKLNKLSFTDIESSRTDDIPASDINIRMAIDDGDGVSIVGVGTSAVQSDNDYEETSLWGGRGSAR